ncbi:MAG: aldo/keto reductase [Candidatus Competibacteraceae bacterium]|nr:aldo/keto reductase [Candidatus Competibacteraceae bacterium]
MQSIILPGTDLPTSRLGFGTASLHHAFCSRERQALLGAALDAGLTHFDTARIYGEGLAERELGRFLGKKTRNEVTIATKFGISANPTLERFPLLMYAQRALGGVGRRLVPQWWDHRRIISHEQAETSLTASLKALQTDWIDILFVHEPQLADVGALLGMADWLERQKACGRVRWLGLAGNARHCIDVAQQTDRLFEILQVEDSLAAHEADVVTQTGHPLQITFGYLRQATAAQPQADGSAVMQAALARNPHGMILVSSRQPQRLRTLVALTA